MARRPSPRGRGWGALIALALAALTFWVSGDPAPLVGVPLACVMLALPPRRPLQLLLAALGVLLALGGAPGNAIWQFDRVFALLLGLAFAALLLFWRRMALTGRALLATLGAVLGSAVYLLVRPGGLSALENQLGALLRPVARQQAELWGRAGLLKMSPEAVQVVSRVLVEGRIYMAPALNALAALAALAFVWGLYRRTTARDEPALAPLREFRFADGLVWLLVAGLLLMLVPGVGADAVRAGSNLAVFMGALYALRGLAVVVSMGSGIFGLWGILLVVFAALAVPPFVLAAAALVGLTDTWLDLRARLAAPSGPGK